MPIKLPNGKFRVQIRIKGHPRIDQVFETKKAATDFEKVERGRIEKNAPLYTLEMTFLEAWTAYRGSMLFRAKKATTRATEESRIERALKELGAYSLAQLVDGQVIARFRDDLGAEKVKVMVRKPEVAPKKASKAKAGKTLAASKPKLVPGHRRDGKKDGTLSNDGQRLVLAAVSSVMLWAVENRIMVYNPVRGLKKPKPGLRERRMERDEELNIFLLAKNATEAHKQLHEDARFVAIQRELGCRPGELSGLLRQDIDLAARALRFRDTKNGDTRVVHVIREAEVLIDLQLIQAELQHPDSPFLFTSLAKEGGSPVRFQHTSAIKRLREAGVVDDDFYAHAARREHCSAAFEAGLPIEDLRKQTGHRSVKALEAYNKSDGLHPDARARVDAAATLRTAERFSDLAAALGVSEEQLREFQRMNAAGPLRLVGETLKQAKVAKAMRRPVSPIVPKSTAAKSTAPKSTGGS